MSIIFVQEAKIDTLLDSLAETLENFAEEKGLEIGISQVMASEDEQKDTVFTVQAQVWTDEHEENECDFMLIQIVWFNNTKTWSPPVTLTNFYI